jgi:Cysteine-rich secretory protein family
MNRSLWIAAMALFAIIPPVSRASSQHSHSDPAQSLLKLANRDRAAHGLSPLKWSAALAAAAHEHALRMAQQNTLSHQLPGEAALAERVSQSGARFSSVAENVAEGPSAESIHAQWMNSPPHRANLLDPQLDSVGIAVENRGGTLFAVQDFSLAVADLKLEEQEAIVSAKLRARGLRLLDFATDARRSCLLDNGYTGAHTPSFVLHYTTADLQNLPAMLEQRIHTGKYHSAVVGACPGAGDASFSNYRIAVLLYE